MNTQALDGHRVKPLFKQAGKGTVLAAGAAAAAVSGQASAAVILVNSLADDVTAGNGQCTLREAINNANADADTTGGDCAAGAGTDTLDLTTLNGTIVLGGTQLAINSSMILQGPAAGSTVTVDANLASRVFYIGNGGAALSVTISRLTLTRGNAAGGYGSAVLNRNGTVTLSSSQVTAGIGSRSAIAVTGFATGSMDIQSSTISGNTSTTNGGAVYVQGGTLTVNNSTLTGNTSGGKGGGISVYNTANAVTISNSTISSNTAGNRGGGIFLYRISGTTSISSSTVSGNTAASRGGGLSLYKVDGPMTIADTTISGNIANNRGGGIFMYKSSAPGTLTIRRSTISGNSANGGSGFGGGMMFYRTNSTILLENTTVSGNTAAQQGGAIYLRGAFGASHLLDIRSSTLASNTAGNAGGNIFGSGFANTINISNSIVAGGSAPTGPDINTGSATINLNFSLLQNTSGATFAGGNNQTGVDPLLGALANNGGTTQTRLIGNTSPARDAGSTVFVTVPATDQRGLARVSGATIDMGAVEIQPLAAAVTATAVPTLSQWAMGLLAAVMAFLGLRRRRPD